MLKRFINDQKDEIEQITGRILDNILLALPSTKGLATYTARRQIGDVRGQLTDLLAADTFGAALLACFTSAREVGASLSGFAYVRVHLLAETPVDFIPTLIVQSALLFCLSAESRIISTMVFVCRDDAEAMHKRMAKAFDDAKESAADDMDSASYQSLTALAASVSVHLARTALLLPRLVTFTMALNYPALKLAQLIYYDPTRTEEIIAENKVVHPLFFPRLVKALSA